MILNYTNPMKGDHLDFKTQLKHLIKENLQNEALKVDWLAVQLHCSERQLYRLVKKHTGKTVNEYIREIRLETANALLQADIYSVKEVAYLVGYNKTSWFSNLYFHRFGKRPKNK